MIRTRITCLALSVSLMAGCAAPVSLNDDPPPSVSHPITSTLSGGRSDLGKVQVFPVDSPAIDSPARELEASPARASARERLRGVLSEQGWQLCGQNQPKSMRASPEMRQALDDFQTHHAVFFLDGWGRAVGSEIELDSVERMYVKGPGCREPLESFAWIAHGQKPFWAFAITRAGIQFRRPGEAPRTHAYTMPQTEDDSIIYAGADYRLTLRRQSCTDATQADARYAWTAELHAEEQQWRGCAWQGMQIE